MLGWLKRFIWPRPGDHAATDQASTEVEARVATELDGLERDLRRLRRTEHPLDALVHNLNQHRARRELE